MKLLKRPFVVVMLCWLLLLLGGVYVAWSNPNACVSGSIANAYCQAVQIGSTGNLIAVNRTADIGNDEVVCYQPQNVFIQNGMLSIETHKQTATCSNGGLSGEGQTPVTFNYTSGFLMTYPFNWQYGDLKVRAKMPSNVPYGGWPAVWMVGSGYQYNNMIFNNDNSPCVWHNTGCQEIDIAEFARSEGLTQPDANFYLDTSQDPSAGSGSCDYNVSDASATFHTYEMLWDASGWHILLDGVDTGCGYTGPATPHNPMFLIINATLSPGQSVSDVIDDSKLPTQMQVQFIEVCSAACNGGNRIFYEDFHTPVAGPLTRPMLHMARIASSPVLPSGGPTQLAGQTLFSGKGSFH